MKLFLLLIIGLFACTAFDINETCYSLRASHILITADNDKEYEKAIIQAKKIKADIESGKTTFEKAALKYGEDATNKRGGDLGWFEKGMMVKPFEETCFTAELNKVYITQTQFGVHLVKVTDKKTIPCK
jgi:parvulin-like peptidyl-prolyl isomerase